MIWPILKEKAKEQGLPLSTVVGEVLHLVVLDVLSTPGKWRMPMAFSIRFRVTSNLYILAEFSASWNATKI